MSPARRSLRRAARLFVALDLRATRRLLLYHQTMNYGGQPTLDPNDPCTCPDKWVGDYADNCPEHGLGQHDDGDERMTGQKVYAVGPWGEEGRIVERIYLDRDEAQQFVDAYNAAERAGEYEIEEFQIGRPTAEYDGIIWKAEWTPRFWLADKNNEPPVYEPRWIPERCWVRSEWHTGNQPPEAEVTYNNGHCINVHGTSKEHVEQLLRDTAAALLTRRETHA